MSYQQKIMFAIIFTVCLINSVVCDNNLTEDKSSDVIGMWFYENK